MTPWCAATSGTELGQQHLADRLQVALALEHAAEPREVRLQPVLLGVAVGRQPQVVDHRVDVVLELRDLAACIDLDRARQVALRDRCGDVRDRAHLCRQVGGEQVHVAGEILPRARGARHVRLAAEAALDADLAGDRRDLVGECRQRLRHVIDRGRQRGDLALGVDGQLLLEVAVGDRGHDFHDAAYLFRQVRGHDVHVVGEVLPGARHARHAGLAAEPALGADFTRNARDLGGERVELVHHRVDGVLQLQNLALHVDGDLARQVALRDRRRDLRDVSDLRRQVRGEQVDVVGQVLPRARDARHRGLTAEPAVGADFARDARDLGRERVELVHHRVDGVLELENLALDVDRDLPRQVALRDGGRDLRDVADLHREVRREQVDVVREVLPGARDARHRGLAAELAFGADLARDARDLGRERVELVHHRVDGFLELKDLAAGIDRDFLGEIAVGDRDRDLGDVAHLGRQVARHRVHRVGQVLPRAADAEHVGLTAKPALGADLARDARDFRRERVELVHHPVDGVLEQQNLAADVDGDLLGQVPASDGRRHFGNVADLPRQVAGHEVDVVREVLPRARHARHTGLTAEPALGADFARHARDLGGEGVELIHHRVDGVLQLENLALDVHRDLARQVAARDGRRDLGDVADLRRQIGRQEVDVVGQVLPRAGDARHNGLTAKLALGADLARHARDLGGERTQLIHHRVDGFLQLQNLAAHIDGDLLGQVAIRHRDRDFRDVADLRRQVAGHQVDAVGQVLPHAADVLHLRLTAELAVGADLACDARHFRRERAQLPDHRVDDGRGPKELAAERAAVHVQPHGLQQVALGDVRERGSDLGRGPQQVVDQCVDRAFHLSPRTVRPVELDTVASLALPADDVPDVLELAGDPCVGRHDLVERVRDLAAQAGPVAGQPHGEVAVAHGQKSVEQLVGLIGRAGEKGLTLHVGSGGATRLHAGSLQVTIRGLRPREPPTRSLAGPNAPLRSRRFADARSCMHGQKMASRRNGTTCAAPVPPSTGSSPN